MMDTATLTQQLADRLRAKLDQGDRPIGRHIALDRIAADVALVSGALDRQRAGYSPADARAVAEAHGRLLQIIFDAADAPASPPPGDPLAAELVQIDRLIGRWLEGNAPRRGEGATDRPIAAGDSVQRSAAQSPDAFGIVVGFETAADGRVLVLVAQGDRTAQPAPWPLAECIQITAATTEERVGRARAAEHMLQPTRR